MVGQELTQPQQVLYILELEWSAEAAAEVHQVQVEEQHHQVVEIVIFT
jgi:hypothetical protein